MHIQLHDDEHATFSRFAEADITHGLDDDKLHFGAVQLMLAALAKCTFSVLATYGERFDTSADDMEIRLAWKFAEKPFRVSDVDMAIKWPSLPEKKLDAATRAAAMCTVHNTLHKGVEIEALVDN